MKQRTRIRRLKARLYPWWIYTDRLRKWYDGWPDTNRKIRDALREAYGSVA